MKAAGEQLVIVESPWSPPPWMKTNGEMNNGYERGWQRAIYNQVFQRDSTSFDSYSQ